MYTSGDKNDATTHGYTHCYTSGFDLPALLADIASPERWGAVSAACLRLVGALVPVPWDQVRFHTSTDAGCEESKTL